MSSTEIEDVLSSIRRLVSDEFRPLTRNRPVAQPVAEPGKLILTPALRIVPQAAPEPQVAAPVAPVAAPLATPPAPAPLPVFVATRRVHLVDTAEAPFAEVDTPAIEQVVASLGAAVTARSEEWEPEHGDAPMAAPEAWDMPEIAFALEPEPEVRLATVAAAVVAEAEAEPETGSAEVTAFVQTTVEDVPAWAQQGGEAEALTDSETAEDPALMVQDAPEPDSDWADAAEASVIASLQAEADGVQARHSAAVDEAEEDEVRFNEDVLRELVRDILREELAGHLGERITRNIRKLVRAEIATLLATQELE